MGNYLLNSVVITHCTLAEDGSAFHQLSRVQSIRRSLRNSMRRSSRVDRRTRHEGQDQGKGKRKVPSKRSGSEPPATLQGESSSSPNMQAAISHMLLSETFLSGGCRCSTHVYCFLCYVPCLCAGPDPTPSLVASTIGSVLIRYSLQLPSTGDRISEPSVAMLAGKDYSLLHGAPVVALLILDNAGIPLPTAYEQDNGISPG